LSAGWQPEQDPEIRRLLQQHYDFALEAYQGEQKKLDNGASTAFQVLRLARQLADAQVQLARTPEEVITAWEDQVRITKQLAAENRKKLEVGSIARLDLLQAEAACVAAEIELLRARRTFQKTPNPPPPGWSTSWQPERDPEIRQLLQSRYEYARQAYEGEMRKLENGASTAFQVLRLARQLANAQVQLAQTPEEMIAAWEYQVGILSGLVTESRKKLQVSSIARLDLTQAEAACVAAQIELLRARRAFQKTPSLSPPGLSAGWQPERDPEIRRLLQRRYDYVLEAYQWEEKKLENGASTALQLLRLAGDLADAKAELAQTPEAVIAASELPVTITTRQLAECRKKLEVGSIARLDVTQAEVDCTTAQIELLRAKRAFQKTP
jgi:outer membrane protein TolC